MRSLQKQIGTAAWISQDALTFMADEFRKAWPNETGGVLLGYWLTTSEGVVITQALGPGPRAKHRETRFVPDCSYHESEIARLYEESGRVHTYLGDWHSHPNANTELSSTDRRTLSTIAKHKEARLPTPLMAIIGKCDPVTIQIWQHLPRSGFGVIRDRIVSLRARPYS